MKGPISIQRFFRCPTKKFNRGNRSVLGLATKLTNSSTSTSIAMQSHQRAQFHNNGVLPPRGLTSSKLSSSTIPDATSMSLMMLTANKRQYLREKEILPRKKRRLPSKRNVTFSTVATVQMRPPTTPSETWYEPKEYAQFESERRETIRAIQSARGDLTLLDPNVYCVRGLEHQLSKKQVLSRKYKSMQYVRALLDHQLLQKQAGRTDPESLHMVSRFFSRQASERAHLRAVLSLATD